eukprot:m.1477728 g.1477728  ORF g.1477728 m.1477728 type:complete len:67 (+) comp25162_c0_seq31:1750-1950(+)
MWVEKDEIRFVTLRTTDGNETPNFVSHMIEQMHSARDDTCVGVPEIFLSYKHDGFLGEHRLASVFC